MTAVLVGGLGMLALGAAGATLWFVCRRSPTSWDRYANAFAASTSVRFSEGFTGSGILLYAGLMAYGVGFLGFALLGGSSDPPALKSNVGLLLFVVGAACMVVGLVSSFVAALTHRPAWLFPHRR